MAVVEEAPARGRATRQESAARREKAGALKLEMDKWVDVLGGWATHGLKTDIAAIAVHLGEGVDQSYMVPGVTLLTNAGTIPDAAYNALSLVNDAFKKAGIKNAARTYVDLVRAANGVALPVGQDWPFEVQLIPLAKLFADESYQRPIHEPFIRELLIKFDERLVGSIDVSQRAGGKFAILDGRQRVETMQQLGKQGCWCAIYTGMTIPQEAAFFFHKNRDRKQMAYFYAFRARMLSGDVDAAMIGEIVTAAKFELGVKTDNMNMIGAVKAIEEVYEYPADKWPNCLAPTLDLIRTCFYGRVGSFDSSLIRGVGKFFQYYDRKEIQWRHFEESLRGLGPQLVLGRARDRDDSLNISTRIGISVATTMAEIHNTGLAKGERLPLERLPRPARQRARRGSRA